MYRSGERGQGCVRCLVMFRRTLPACRGKAKTRSSVKPHADMANGKRTYVVRDIGGASKMRGDSPKCPLFPAWQTERLVSFTVPGQACASNPCMSTMPLWAKSSTGCFAVYNNFGSRRLFVWRSERWDRASHTQRLTPQYPPCGYYARIQHSCGSIACTPPPPLRALLGTLDETDVPRPRNVC